MDTPALKKFQVRLHGENFLLARVGGAPRVFGFYTTRWVEAPDPEAAEIAAVDLVRSDPDLVSTVRNPRDNSPMIYLDSLREIPSFEGLNPPGKGYTFYEDSEEKT